MRTSISGMGSRLRGIAPALTLGLCGLASLTHPGVASSSPAGHRASTPPLGGINADGLGYRSTAAEADRTLAAARALRVRVLRVELPWAVLEPRSEGSLDTRALAYTDRLINGAAAAGMGVVAVIDGTPCWASSAPARLRHRCSPGRRSAANTWPPSQPDTYAAFMRLLAERYGSKLTALEVWNEPDQANQKYFAGPAKPQRYAAILRAAYTAIKQVDPEIKVLAGSLVGANGVFLRALYAAGIRGYYDGLGVHFYTLTLGSIRAFHQVQLANGDHTPLWLDEFGWTSCYPRKRVEEQQACVTRAIQARNVTNVYRALSGVGYVAAVTLYELQDEGREQFGVLTWRGRRKPAFRALARVLASPSGRESRVTLHLRRAHGRVIAHGSGPVGDYMQLEAFRGSTLRYRALFILDRFNRYSIALPRVLGRHGLRVRVYQYWAGPARGAQRSI
jgi:polysaccharide biosynthesis protein PslG